MPAAGTPILHTIGYYMHAGGHGTISIRLGRVPEFMQMHLQAKR